MQRDVLTGGLGNDTFNLDGYNDTNPSISDSFATITDLQPSNDKIILPQGPSYRIGLNTAGRNVIFIDTNENGTYQQNIDDTIALLSNQQNLPLGAISSGNPAFISIL